MMMINDDDWDEANNLLFHSGRVKMERNTV